MGKSIALALLKQGAEVVILERLKDDLQKFKEEVRPTPSQTAIITPFLTMGFSIKLHTIKAVRSILDIQGTQVIITKCYKMYFSVNRFCLRKQCRP